MYKRTVLVKGGAGVFVAVAVEVVVLVDVDVLVAPPGVFVGTAVLVAVRVLVAVEVLVTVDVSVDVGGVPVTVEVLVLTTHVLNVEAVFRGVGGLMTEKSLALLSESV